MKKIKITTSATLYTAITEMSSEDQILMNKAIEAKKNAYAPYSKFSVGAAILLENNETILGNNQENAAYPSGMCAERVAIWRAGSEFPNIKIQKIAIIASSSISKVNQPIGPCGACRQALSEYEIKQHQPFEVIFKGEFGDIIKTNSLAALLPFHFDSTYL